MIIDASIAIKWIKEEEEYRKQALELLRNHLNNKEKITVPSLFFIEVANSLVTKSATLPIIIEKQLKFIYDKELKIYEPNAKDIVETTLLSKEYATTVYDMLYAIIAKKHRTILITADGKFIKKTKFSYVKHISKI